MVHRITQRILKEQKHRDFVQLISLVASVGALTFQTTVLYPWHNTMSIQINELQNKK
jgi:hypothetical protein